MQVKLLDLSQQYEPLKDEILSAIAGLMDRQAFILGPAVEAFEKNLARYCDVKHAIGVSSGTDALLCALMAMGIGPGDEVIVPTFTFFASAGCVARTGAKVVFCDIDPATFNLDPADVANRITDRTKAIMPVHLFGQVADMDAINRIASERNLMVIEDAAQAIGAKRHGKRACSLSTAGCLSFYPTKNLGAFGDAGMCVTNDPALAERIEVLRVHGGKPKYFHSFIGGNFRIDEIQAAVLNIKLRHLDTWSAARQRNARIYDEAFDAADLGNAVQTPRALEGVRHIFNQYVIRARDRDLLRQHLMGAAVGTEIYYPVPLHLQACFAYLKYRKGDFPHAERAAEEVLALPIFPELTEAQLRYVVDCIADFYRR